MDGRIIANLCQIVITRILTLECVANEFFL